MSHNTILAAVRQHATYSQLLVAAIAADTLADIKV